MDAAGNLRELYKILRDEQSQEAIQELAREFPLVHVRALEVKNQLELFLGIQKAASPGMGDPNQMAMMQQQMMQQQQMMMQQMQQQAGQAGGAGKANRKRQTDVFLVANPRQKQRDRPRST